LTNDLPDIHERTLDLARRLIGCRSVTPSDGGALDLIAHRLHASGFSCERIDRNGVANLWARRGGGRPLVCLAGHIDVVPPGPIDQWTSDPFVASERDGCLYGRGAADMKTSVAAMVTAAERLVARNAASGGSIALLLTSDEEGDATDGTIAVVDALRARGETIDACILGEPTSNERFGDTMKNGRRGSLNGVLRVRGTQCHIAYPERGRNPIHDTLPALAELTSRVWDRGNEHFQPTSLQISNIHAGTGAVNVIPGELTLLFNFRFSPESTVEALEAATSAILDAHHIDYELTWTVAAAPFTTARGSLTDAVATAVRDITGVTPELSTSGGTSDGRFLAPLVRQIVEFGPLNGSIHKIDECVALADIAPLSRIYERAVELLLGSPSGRG
jgi:succinyl-diaminopimelate desuccinylase